MLNYNTGKANYNMYILGHSLSTQYGRGRGRFQLIYVAKKINIINIIIIYTINIIINIIIIILSLFK